jgi:hypothetical protein
MVEYEFIVKVQVDDEEAGSAFIEVVDALEEVSKKTGATVKWRLKEEQEEK